LWHFLKNKIREMKSLFIRMGLLLTFMLFVLVGCKKDKPDPIIDPTPTSGTVKLKFDHKWGMTWDAFTMNTEHIHPSTSEAITFTTLKYYISNVKLKKEDGTWWEQPESYHLITVDDNTVPEISLENVPTGNYTEIEYMIGVDSTRNVSGAQTGALSTTNGMFWSWTTGYIFIKAEGTSPDAPSDFFSYHIGGFKEENNTNATRVNTQSFDGMLSVTGSNHPSVHFYINVARFWHGGISLADLNTVHMPGANALTLADNFRGAFIVHHIH